MILGWSFSRTTSWPLHGCSIKMKLYPREDRETRPSLADLPSSYEPAPDLLTEDITGLCCQNNRADSKHQWGSRGDYFLPCRPFALNFYTEHVGSWQALGNGQAMQNSQQKCNQTTYAFANVSCQEEGSYDNEEGPDHEEHNSQCNCLVRDFWWALLELDQKNPNIKKLNSAQFPSHHGRNMHPTASRDDMGQTVAAALLQGFVTALLQGILPIETPLSEPAFTPIASRSAPIFTSL